MKWILCCDKMPNHEALFCDTRGNMLIGYGFEDEEDSDTGYTVEAEGMFLFNAVAWMELPEPYKEDKKE